MLLFVFLRHCNSSEFNVLSVFYVPLRYFSLPFYLSLSLQSRSSNCAILVTFTCMASMLLRSEVFLCIFKYFVCLCMCVFV